MVKSVLLVLSKSAVVNLKINITEYANCSVIYLSYIIDVYVGSTFFAVLEYLLSLQKSCCGSSKVKISQRWESL